MSINSDDMFFQPWKADWLCHIRRRNEAVREKNVTVFKINGSCKALLSTVETLIHTLLSSRPLSKKAVDGTVDGLVGVVSALSLQLAICSKKKAKAAAYKTRVSILDIAQ